MRGTYQHCAEKHLHRYLVEFDFRQNNHIALGVDDSERANDLARGIVGERRTYRRPNSKNEVAPFREACEAFPMLEKASCRLTARTLGN
jgi:hypothetical protein